MEIHFLPEEEKQQNFEIDQRGLNQVVKNDQLLKIIVGFRGGREEILKRDRSNNKRRNDEDLKVEKMEREHTFYYAFYFCDSLFQLRKMDSN